MRFVPLTTRRANRKFANLSFERLEGRDVPNGAVFTSLVGGSLVITGDTSDNQITLSAGGLNTIAITPTGGTTVDGSSNTVLRSFSRDLDIFLGRGTDSVTFDLGPGSMAFRGNVVLNYGSAGTGDKMTTTVNAGTNTLSVANSMVIRYAGGDVTTTLDNIAIAGSLVVTHGSGDSTFSVDNLKGAGSFSSIGGSLDVTNTIGKADNSVTDTNVGRSEAFVNGKARAADNAAGSTQIFNENNTTPANVGSNISISNTNGDSAIGDVVADVHVLGSVGLKLGTGNFNATVASRMASPGPSISGSLSVSATSTWTGTVALGAPGTGLTVKRNLAVSVGNGNATVAIDDADVLATTTITTGKGNDQITIDGTGGDAGSVFAGAVALNTGAGTDTLSVNSGGASSAVTDFKGSFVAKLGVDDDALTLATSGKVKFDAPSPKTLLVDGSTGVNTKTVTLGNIVGRVPTFRNFV
jgi:hypothetical protein